MARRACNFITSLSEDNMVCHNPARVIDDRPPQVRDGDDPAAAHAKGFSRREPGGLCWCRLWWRAWWCLRVVVFVRLYGPVEPVHVRRRLTIETRRPPNHPSNHPSNHPPIHPTIQSSTQPTNHPINHPTLLQVVNALKDIWLLSQGHWSVCDGLQ